MAEAPIGAGGALGASFVLAVDKPVGPTSHDVVRWARRVFRTRAVGHAGTLDPGASGVLVLCVGEATKLVPYLTLDDKEYETTVALGAETDTLDADGEVVLEAAVPPLDRARVEAIAAAFLGVHDQAAPIFSAIKRDGVSLHERARRGEAVEAPIRSVEAMGVTIGALRGDAIDVHLWVGKGYYVRSFARDFARALGTLGHVERLRRTRSGAFTLEAAIDGDALQQATHDEAARERLLEAAGARHTPLLDALAPTMATIELDEALERDARHGKPVCAQGLTALEEGGLAALAREGRLVAIARRTGDALRVVRGFASVQAAAS